jgi:MSHA biogenesis protein MshO
MSTTRSRGFTLIELIIVIVLLGIISLVVASFISGPIRAYVDQARRTALVDTADGALRRISREIRRALPNSVRVQRVGSVSYLELIPVTAGGRYRDTATPGFANAADWLDFSQPDGAFTLSGRFQGLAGSFSSRDHHLVIYNDGTAGANAYDMAGVVTPAGTQIDVSDAGTVDRVTLTPLFQFTQRSPVRRVYLVAEPISFACEDNGELRLWRNYGFESSQPSDLAAAGGTSALLAADMAGCEFSYEPGTHQRAGVVTLVVRVRREGEEVRLLHQVHVLNSP